MIARTMTYDPQMAPLGSAVVAIGVFDGVHLGHRALLRDTVSDAAARGCSAVAVTFDRDPDQVVSPDTAAPQLLTLADKIRFIAETGIDTVLVVPFTSSLADMAPEVFVDSVLLRAVSPVTVHIGGDFRFGHMATGDVGTLQRSGLQHDFEVIPHELVSRDGAPVTSTRIRGLVAAGNVTAAADLLGRPPRVAGTVRRGRGEGAGLGFPTANVVPVPFAALPAAGVYAGRAIVADGAAWASAISVGTPPMFPDARDYLEAHLIGFAGDLYDEPLTLEFFERLRSQQSYPGLEALKDAIAEDVERSLRIGGFIEAELAQSEAAGDPQPAPAAAPAIAAHIDDSDSRDSQPAERTSDAWESNPVSAFRSWLFPGSDGDEDMGDLEDGTPVVEDPDALMAAERSAMNAPAPFAIEASGEWVTLLDSVTTVGGPSAAVREFEVTSPLQAASIPYAWHPYPPSDRPTSLQGGGAYPECFSVIVPAERLDEAREALAQSASLYAAETATADDPDSAVDFDEQAPAVDDPAALEAAEEAVREMRTPAVRSHENDEWVVLLEKMPYERSRLDAIDHALDAGGIEHVWEPYPPDHAPLLMLAILGSNTFSVSVFESDLTAAQALLASLREFDE